MNIIKKIQVNGKVYDIYDTGARSLISKLIDKVDLLDDRADEMEAAIKELSIKENTTPFDSCSSCCDEIFYNLDSGMDPTNITSDIAGNFLCTNSAHSYLANNGRTITLGDSWTKIGFYGWTDTPDIAAFGYEVNGEVHLDCPDNGKALVNDVQSFGYTRMNVVIDVSGWEPGKHTVRLIYRTGYGTISAINAWGDMVLIKK